MSNAAAHAAIFYREVAETGALWTIRDDDGFPAPLTPDGVRAQPFWSSQSRAERIIKHVAAYEGFSAHEITWAEFESRWAPGLARDGILVGVNWSGARATGYDVPAPTVSECVRAQIASKAS